MKKFAKSPGGKFLLFLLCLLCASAAVGSGLLAGVLASGDVYNRTEQEIINSTAKSLVCQKGYDLVLEALNAEEPPVRLADRGNLEAIVLDAGGNILGYSRNAAAAQKNGFFYSMTYRLHTNGVDSWLEDVDSPLQEADANVYTVRVAFTEGLPTHDIYYYSFTLLHLAYALRYWVYAILLCTLALAIVCFVLLMAAAGRRNGDDALHQGPLYRVPFDLLTAMCVALAVVVVLPLGSLPDLLLIALMTAYAVVCGAAALGLCVSAAARSKAHALWKNTVIYRILHLIWRGLSRLPLVWRTCLILLGNAFVQFILLLIVADGSSATGAFLWFIWTLSLSAAVLYIALCLRRLQRGGQALAAGELGYHTDTKNLIFDLKRHGENLNSIASGMNAAVEQRLRSERMKTELITNVSHDLKTPLTSVINYADLISKEPCDNPKITEYSEVLTRQSERLRRLIEDLVEASKASTGNLEVNPVPCDAAVFVTQAAGEYTQRLQQQNLTLVTVQPETPVRIMADGRRMWRIFDNLMGNICKYAQPGTRVYLTLEVMSGNAVITFKNTSRDPLNISENELMERFVRADTSRSTEGNGLGLSIARSLAELQGGSLRLFIDGDLFKAILIFPQTAGE